MVSSIPKKRKSIFSKSRRFAKRSKRELVSKTLDEDYPGLDYLGCHDVLVAKKRWYCYAWFIILILCLIGGIVTVAQVVREYGEKPSVTKVTVKSVEQLPLPIVSVCPTSAGTINIDRLHDYFIKNYNSPNGEPVSMEDARNFAAYITAGSGFQKVAVNKIANISLAVDMYETMKGNQTVQAFFNYFFDTFGLQCEDLFQECQIRLHKFNCCDLFQPFYAIRRGRCFRMSYRLNQTTFDEMGRLSIRMRTHIDSLNQDGGKDLIAYIGDERTEIAPFPRFYLYPNTTMRLQIKAVHIDLMEEDEICSEQTDTMGKSTCYLDSWFRNYLETPYNCTYPYMNAIRNVTKPSCHPSTVVENYADTVENPHYHKHACFLPCKRWEYTALMERVQFNNPLATFRLDIFYNDLQYEEFTGVYTTTFWGLLAQIGGQLSLFLGSSILSLIQLAILGVVVSKRVVRHAVDEKLGTTSNGHNGGGQTLPYGNMDAGQNSQGDLEMMTSLGKPPYFTESLPKRYRPESFTEPRKIYKLDDSEDDPSIREIDSTCYNRGDKVAPTQSRDFLPDSKTEQKIHVEERF